MTDDIELPPGPADTDDDGLVVRNDVVEDDNAEGEPAAGMEPEDA